MSEDYKTWKMAIVHQEIGFKEFIATNVKVADTSKP